MASPSLAESILGRRRPRMPDTPMGRLAKRSGQLLREQEREMPVEEALLEAFARALPDLNLVLYEKSDVGKAIERRKVGDYERQIQSLNKKILELEKSLGDSRLSMRSAETERLRAQGERDRALWSLDEAQKELDKLKGAGRDLIAPKQKGRVIDLGD